MACPNRSVTVMCVWCGNRTPEYLPDCRACGFEWDSLEYDDPEDDSDLDTVPEPTPLAVED